MTAAARIIIGAVLVLTAAAVEVRAQIIDLFDAREHRCSEGRFAGKVFQYRLFVPRGQAGRALSVDFVVPRRRRAATTMSAT